MVNDDLLFLDGLQPCCRNVLRGDRAHESADFSVSRNGTESVPYRPHGGRPLAVPSVLTLRIISADGRPNRRLSR